MKKDIFTRSDIFWENENLKELCYFLIRGIEEIESNVFIRNFVVFELKELIDAGVYKTGVEARRSFLNDIETLMTLKLERGNSSSVVFTGANVEHRSRCDICLVYINRQIGREDYKKLKKLLENLEEMEV